MRSEFEVFISNDAIIENIILVSVYISYYKSVKRHIKSQTVLTSSTVLTVQTLLGLYNVQETLFCQSSVTHQKSILAFL